MAKFRKKPVEIEAFRFYVDAMPDWFLDQMSDNTIMIFNCDYNRYGIDDAYCTIKTLEGTMRGNGGDYIIKGIQGEIYPCKPDIFEKTYENATEKTVTLTEKDFENMLDKVELLECLQACGVDNWQGYDDAMMMFYDAE